MKISQIIFRKFENIDKHKKKRIAFNPTTQI